GDQLHVVAARSEDLEVVREIVARIAQVEPAVDAGAREVTAPASGGVASIGALADALADADIAVEDLGLRQPTLDDAFLTLTGRPAPDDAVALEESR
ncbi:MAG: type transport system ATP-binding protein, partial [Baekduia sp.]|nr:type transport system ATP-binding protein [Baekduia sp.]